MFAVESSCLPFKVSSERQGNPASAVQSVGDVDDLQLLSVPQLLQVLLYLILDNRGQHLLNLPQLDEELSLVRQHRLCEGCRTTVSLPFGPHRGPYRTFWGFYLNITRTCGDFDDEDLSGCFIAPLVDGEDL